MRALPPSRSVTALCLLALVVSACAGSSSGDASPACEAPLAACAGACVDLQADAAHCGACGASCGPEQTCAAGHCAFPPCPAGLARCGAACVDLLADEGNCGACGVACDGTRCQLGACPGATCAGVLGLPGPPALAIGTAAPVGIAAGDLDGDGSADLVLVTSAPSGSGELKTFLGFGLGAFEPGPALSISPLAAAAALGDVDPASDSSLDVAIAFRAATEGVRLHRGEGNGTFTALPADSAGAVGGHPQAILLADVDGDGDDDLLVGAAAEGVAPGDPNVRVLLNDGAGVFGSGTGPAPRPADHAFTVAGAPNAFAVADVDVDGILDVAVAHDGGFAVLYMTASGLRQAVEVPTPRRAAGLAVAYVDSDGWLDLAAADPDGNGVFVAVAVPNTVAFGVLAIPAGLAPRALVAADLDLDGRTELIAADEGGGTATILTNTAVSGLSLARTSVVAGTGPVAIAAARLDGDLLPDLAVADSAGNASVLLADGTESVIAPRAYRAASGAALVLLDLDGGGTPALDVALADWAGDAIAVRLGNGDGTFGAAVTHDLPAFGDPVALAGGDADGDGSADLAAALRIAGKVALLWGNGGGGFSAPGLVPAGTLASPSGVALADLDGAGGLDLLVTASGADELVVLLASGVRGFGAPSSTAVCDAPAAVARGRLDADALDDVAVACEGDGNVGVLLRDPAAPGGFLPLVSYPAAAGASGAAIADLDGDSDLDVAVSARSAGAAVVLSNDGAGGFAAGATFPACAGAAGIAAGDVTGDGVPDLAVACAERGGTAILRGLGGGAFAPPLLYATGGSPRAVALGDLDGDGAAEAVSANDTPAFAAQGGGLVVQRRACVGP